MEKRNNHIIPRVILKQWNSFNQNRFGVYCYEIADKKTIFSESKGKRGYSFAIEEDFYIPKIQNERKVNVENWFAGMEDMLGLVIKRLNVETEKSFFKNREEFTKFSMALFSLKHRTKYRIEQIIKHLIGNPEQKKLVQASLDRDVHLVALENLVHAITDDTIGYANYELLVCRNTMGDLIIGDEPFMAEVVDGYNFVTLSPYFFIAFRKHGKSTFAYLPSNEKMIDTLNRTMAQNARYWVVAQREEVLSKYIETALLPKEELDPGFQKVRYLNRGYTID